MGKKILDSRILYAVLAIIIAVALWLYVSSLDGNEETHTISNIPVQFEGLETLESKGLMIVGEAPTVSLRLTAPFSSFTDLDKDSITVTVDVSRIDEASEYTMGYTVTYPSSVSNSVSEESRTPTNVTFSVVRYTSREIDLKGSFQGSVEDGYLAGDSDDFIFSPSTITVSGQENLVNQISYAQVIVTGDNFTETIGGEYQYQLMSNSGEVLDGLNVDCSVDSVYVTFPIWATAEIPLSVNFIDGGGIKQENVIYEIDHSSIMISGDKSDVSAISQIELEPIDLAEVHNGDVITRKIPLTNELNNLSGFTEVNITIHITGVQSKSLETNNISCSNVPDGWMAELITQAITVEVRGPQEEIESITSENIRVVVDLSEVNHASGQYSISAKVYLDSVGADAGVVGSDYKVVVSMIPVE